MPVSNAPRKQEILDLLERRFGVPASALADIAWAEGAGGEIWLSTAAAARDAESGRPSGLRAFRPSPDGLKPTSAFLVAIGPLITAARVDLDRPTLRALLLGRRCATAAVDGYAALSCDGIVLGCGFVADGNVRCLVPTGRRHELLNVLDAEPTAEAPEM